VLSAIGPHRWAGRRGPALVILTYHRVLPARHPERNVEQPGMIVEPETLELHLGLLTEFFEPVHLDDWVSAAAHAEPLPRRACAVTFDDGWRDNHDHAWPILRRLGFPATIFLVSDLVGSTYSFWPNRLARNLVAWDASRTSELGQDLAGRLRAAGIPLDMRGAGLSLHAIDGVIEHAKGLSDSHLQELMADWERAIGDGPVRSPDLMTWGEARRMADSGLVRFGSHSRRHTRLREGVSLDTMEDEISGSKRVLEQNLGGQVRLFCFPNGDYTPDALSLVRRHYAGAVTTKSGWTHARSDMHLLPRVGMHQDVSHRPDAFLAKLSGWI